MHLRFASMGTLLLTGAAWACTAFTTTQGGRTYVGNNEDARSINPQVRFEQGRNGGYGGIYFGHFNGHPIRTMTDQLGMNEAGLVYDGLRIQYKDVPAAAGLKRLDLLELMPLVMRSCATVQEAAAFLRAYDLSVAPHALIFLADKHGGYLLVENDTIIEGHDPWYAVGNWRMGSCSNPDSIPIPRLQAGRALLSTGQGGSLEEARAALERMTVCRKKMGEGTLFSTLFDPGAGEAHLYFYHDLNEGVTFNLQAELAKGDRTVEMASLFGPRPEFERLKAYITPFHQRWLFWGMLGWAVVAGIIGLCCLVTLCIALFKRKPGWGRTTAVMLLVGVGCLGTIGLLGVLLMQEGVYYFGLADLHPLLIWLPHVLLVLMIAAAAVQRKRKRRTAFPVIAGATFVLPLFLMLGYWGLWWP